MAWLTLIVDADATHADSLSEALLELGALSVDVHDAHADTLDEQPIFGEPGEPPPTLWTYNRITALFPGGTPVEEILRQAAQAVGLPQIPAHRIETLADMDWVRLT